MSEKRTRISLAQKLDIIEASKKSGFSIEYVMEEVWFEEIFQFENHSNALNVNKRLDKNHSTALNVSKSFGCEPFNSQMVFN